MGQCRSHTRWCAKLSRTFTKNILCKSSEEITYKYIYAVINGYNILVEINCLIHKFHMMPCFLFRLVVLLVSQHHLWPGLVYYVVRQLF